MFRISRPIEDALMEGRPVVALETAVLTHGFDKSVGITVYSEMTKAVLEGGAVPAPVGILGGVLLVGLDDSQLAALAASEKADKAAVPDLPALCSSGGDAGTTAAATLFAAKKAGIRVMATGGIGGVHRGAESTFDVSGDLAALSRFGGCLVCSGAKSVCDLPKTMELLETLGVTVAGYGTQELPAFTSITSGIALRHRVDDPAGAAALVRSRDALGLSGSVLIANPPPEEAAVDAVAMEEALAGAVAGAKTQGVTGPEVTPHLLAELARRTRGASAAANRALLVANAGLAARIARELSES